MRQGEGDIVEFIDVLIASSRNSDGEWILDSGCSFHMTPNRSLFESFSGDHNGTVILGNNKTCDIKGIGSITIKNHDENLKILQEVRYVPDLKRNLLSIGMFDKGGYSVQIDGGNMRISKGSQTVIRGKLDNGLYVLDGKSV